MAAGKTYTPIATQTLSNNTSTITFSSISQAYTDLIIVVKSGATVATANGFIRFNSDSTSSYSQTTLRGNGSAAASDRITGATEIALDYYGFSTDLTNNVIIQIQNYSNSTTYKTTLHRIDTANYGTVARVGLWRNTNAITSISFISSAYAFIVGSTFTLYGIAAA
jgi:hypothetical protein